MPRFIYPSPTRRVSGFPLPLASAPPLAAQPPDIPELGARPEPLPPPAMAPAGESAAPALPQLPPKPNPPSLGRKIAGTALSVFGLHPIAEEIQRPGYRDAMNRYGLEMESAQQAQAMNESRAREASARATEALRNRQASQPPEAPKPIVLSEGGTLVHPVTGQVIASSPRPSRPVALSEGGTLVNSETGETIALGSPKRQPETPGEAFERRKREAESIGLKPGTRDYQSYVGGRSLGTTPAPTPTLTPYALDIAALNYLRTGTLPAMGMGAAAERAKIINRAGEMAPGTDIAVNRADYDRLKASLSDIERQKNRIGAFEKTAMKNLDLFIQSAQAAMDAKSPIINRPFRGGAREIMGSDQMAEFDALRVTAYTEVARVLSGNMSAILSDASRREAESVLRGDYTIPSLVAAVNALKQDMANRMQSFDDQIAEIQAALQRSSPIGSGQGAGTQQNSGGTSGFDFSRFIRR